MSGRTFIGIAVAGFATFMWGFVFWGATTVPYKAWDSVANDAEVQSELARMFPQSGYYSIPSVTQNSAEESVALLNSGVWATVNIDHDPSLPGDPANMGLGLVHNILVMFLLAVLMKHMQSNQMRTAILVGLTATAFSNLGDVIWWNFPLDWKLTIMAYDMGFWILGGFVLSYFVREGTS